MVPSYRVPVRRVFVACRDEGPLAEDKTNDASLKEAAGDEELNDHSYFEPGCSDVQERAESGDEDPESATEGGALPALFERVAKQTAGDGSGEDEHETRLRRWEDDVNYIDDAPCDVDNEKYGDFQGSFDSGADPSPLEPAPLVDVGGGPNMPKLATLHRLAPSFEDSRTVEGGAENLRHNTKAAGSQYYPFCTKEQLLIFVWQHTHQVSQKALGGLLEVLLMEDEGEGFDVRGLAGVDAAHFNDRMRPYLPLLLVVERDVPSTQQGTKTSPVYDFPLTVLLDRDTHLPSETALSVAYPGGKVLRGEEAAENGLASDHVNCVPTRPVGNVRGSNHHGTLARSTPFYGIDDIIAKWKKDLRTRRVRVRTRRSVPPVSRRGAFLPRGSG